MHRGHWASIHKAITNSIFRIFIPIENFRRMKLKKCKFDELRDERMEMKIGTMDEYKDSTGEPCGLVGFKDLA